MTDPTMVAVCFDYDCDGTSISYHNMGHEEWDGHLPYGENPDTLITLDDFCEKIYPLIETHDQEYWIEHGYFNDHSGIRNCEIARPVEPMTLSLLEGI